MKNNILGIFALSFVIVFASCESSTDKKIETENTNATEQVSITEEKVSSGINFFHGTWEEALAKAKEEDKLIFLDAYATWCGPCKRMAKNVFPQAELSTVFNENFINYKMDMEKGVGPALAKKLKLEAYPTLYFLDANTDLVSKSIGYMNVDKLKAFANENIQ